jgi:hypothetical protein
VEDVNLVAAAAAAGATPIMLAQTKLIHSL